MAEFHYIPRDPVKSIPQSYPKPKCDPKKNLIHLTPAASRPVMEDQMSYVFRSSCPNVPRRYKRTPVSDPPTSSDEDDDDKSIQSDRSASNSPTIPHARYPPSLRRGTAVPDLSFPSHHPGGPFPPALSPAARNRTVPSAHPYGPPAARHAPEPGKMSSQKGFSGATRSSTRGYSMGSTIPRHAGQNVGMCSPAASLGRGNPNAVNKVLQSAQRY